MGNTNADAAAAAAAELQQAISTVLQTLNGDLEASPLHAGLSELAAYAWSGITTGDPERIPQLLSEIGVAVELLGGNLMTPSGEELVSQETRQYINRVANAATARWQIDQGDKVTIDMLAELAKVTERTIRTAMNRSSDPLPIVKEGHWTFIEAGPALKWLLQRPDFVPTQVTDFRPRVSELRLAANVGEAWSKWREGRGLSIEDLTESCGWSAEQERLYAQVEAGEWSDGVLTLAPGFWRTLAAHMGSDEAEDVAAATYLQLAGGYAQWRIDCDAAGVTG